MSGFQTSNLRRLAASGVGLADDERRLLIDAACEIESFQRGAQRLLEALDPRSDEFAEQVEEAWWNEMQGELRIVGEEADRPTRDLVERLGAFAAEHVREVGNSVDQFDGHGQPLPGNAVAPEEIARRVARAIAVACYGGK